MLEYLFLYLSAIFLWIIFYNVGRLLYNDNQSILKLKTIISILIFSIFLALINYYNFEIFNGILKILAVYALYCLFFKIVYNKSWSKVITASLILYLSLCASEVIIAIVLSLLFSILNLELSIMKNTILINILVGSATYLLIYLLRKKLVKFANSANLIKNSKILIVIIILITLALLGYKLPVNEWKFSVDFIITMLVLLAFCTIGVFMLKQNSDIQKTTSMYQEVVKYSNTTNKLLEDYRMVSHEHKNQLSIIRQMVDKENKELLDYIDNLIEKRTDIKYKWVADLNNLPLDGLRGLINYKLLEAEEKKINIAVTISKEVSKVKLNKLSTKQRDDLYSIIGVYLDNAIQASNESNNKNLDIEIHKYKKNLAFIIGNTYKGKININRLDDYGYSTKGKNHGIGLHIVKKILDDSNLFIQTRKIIDDYYIQELTININNIKNKTTK